MDWTSGNLRTFVPVVPRPETSFDLLYNYEQFQGMEMMKHMHAAAMAEKASSSSSIGLVPGEAIMERNIQERKKRLTSDQLESLERSFQEEIKLDPDRKMKLSRELGLQPRQIAVWFQNRRARWKSKQLELLYDSLKQEYNAISREKLKLQEEVKKLKCTLRARNNKQGITEVTGEETVESTSVAATRSSNKDRIADLFNVDDYNPAVSSPFCGLLPSNYQ